jgi:hypothetical protein
VSRARLPDRSIIAILGVDPRIHGGLAIVTLSDNAAPQLVDAIDIPVTGTKAKERVDVAALRSWIETHHPQHALIERAQAMPKQGANSRSQLPVCAGNVPDAHPANQMKRSES